MVACCVHRDESGFGYHKLRGISLFLEEILYFDISNVNLKDSVFENMYVLV